MDGDRLQVVEHDLVGVIDQADHISADALLALEIADVAEALHVLANPVRSSHRMFRSEEAGTSTRLRHIIAARIPSYGLRVERLAQHLRPQILLLDLLLALLTGGPVHDLDHSSPVVDGVDGVGRFHLHVADGPHDGHLQQHPG